MVFHPTKPPPSVFQGLPCFSYHGDLDDNIQWRAEHLWKGQRDGFWSYIL